MAKERAMVFFLCICSVLCASRQSHAKEKIRQWFKRQQRDENIAHGRQSLDRDLRRLARTSLDKVPHDQLQELSDQAHFTTLDDFFAAIGYGAVSAQSVVTRLGIADDSSAVLPQVAPPSALRR